MCRIACQPLSTKYAISRTTRSLGQPQAHYDSKERRSFSQTPNEVPLRLRLRTQRPTIKIKIMYNISTASSGHVLPVGKLKRAFAHHAVFPVAQRQWRVCRQVPQLNLLPKAFVVHLEQHLTGAMTEMARYAAQTFMRLNIMTHFCKHTARLTRAVHSGEETTSTMAAVWVSCTKLAWGRLSGKKNTTLGGDIINV